MKIVVIDNLPEGGAKRVVWQQLSHLTKSHQVLHCTNAVQSQFRLELPDLQQSVIPYQPPTWRGLLRPVSDASLFSQLKAWYSAQHRLIKSWQPDVILAHPCQVTQAPLILDMERKIPTVYFMEEMYRVYYEKELQPKLTGIKEWYETKKRSFIHSIDQACTSAATQIITTSQYVRSELQQEYNLNSIVIPLGVNSDIFRPLKPAVEPQHFLFIGERIEINGYDLVLQTQKLHKKKLPIKVVTFSKKQLSYTDTQLNELYNQSYGVLCLAIKEPFGLTALEGMSCQVPVIAVKQGGYLDTVNTQTGFLIDRDPQQLQLAINSLWKSGSLRKKLGLAGRVHVLKNFSWEKHYSSLDKVLISVSKSVQ